MTASVWSSIFRVSIVLLIGLISTIALQLSLRGIENHMKDSGMGEDRFKRMKTLVHVGRSIGRIIILLMVVLMILYELKINITPILASAGVVGLAFSLGAQTIIKDYLGGILILTENQLTIGDTVTIEQITGKVEHITLRATYIRDSEGRLILIPNGDIRTVSNLTTHWAQVVVTFNVDYDAEMEQALQALEKAAYQVQSNKEIAPALIESPYALGWTGFTDWAVQMQIIAKTRPGQQWVVARAIRRIALELLQKEGIHVAIPRQRSENV
jgi:small-conductance mechanosensitive channel